MSTGIRSKLAWFRLWLKTVLSDHAVILAVLIEDDESRPARERMQAAVDLKKVQRWRLRLHRLLRGSHPYKS